MSSKRRVKAKIKRFKFGIFNAFKTTIIHIGVRFQSIQLIRIASILFSKHTYSSYLSWHLNLLRIPKLADSSLFGQS